MDNQNDFVPYFQNTYKLWLDGGYETFDEVLIINYFHIEISRKKIHAKEHKILIHFEKLDKKGLGIKSNFTICQLIYIKGTIIENKVKIRYRHKFENKEDYQDCDFDLREI